MKTILITGCSSGFGLETAKYFLSHNWRVIATMRIPRPELLPVSENLTILPLDVTNDESIEHLVAQVDDIDVLVNNAGIAAVSTLENTDMSTIKNVFETNTFGPIAMIKAFLPKFRSKKAGTIINVTSSVALKPYPLFSIYTGSKVAINAFTEVLSLELAQFNIRVHVIMPGASPETNLGSNASSRMGNSSTPAYDYFTNEAFSKMANFTETTKPSDVAESIWLAATDVNAPMFIASGADAVKLMEHH